MFAHGVEQVSDGADVLVGRALQNVVAVLDVLLHLASVVTGHRTVLRQVTLAAHKHDEHFVRVLVLNVVRPFYQLVVRALVVDCVAQDANFGPAQEKVCEIVHRSVASCIPDVKC